MAIILMDNHVGSFGRKPNVIRVWHGVFSPIRHTQGERFSTYHCGLNLGSGHDLNVVSRRAARKRQVRSNEEEVIE